MENTFRVCITCKQNKCATEFSKHAKSKDGLNRECKRCSCDRACKWAKENPKKVQINNEKWAKKNREKVAAIQARSFQKHKDKRRQARRQYFTEYMRNRRKTDSNFRLLSNIRGRLCSFIRMNGTEKSKTTIQMIGCNLQELKAHLEAQFRPGMSWENYGRVWHVDHIFPLSKANLNDPEEFQKVTHFSNLQPLFAAENIRKGNKVA